MRSKPRSRSWDFSVWNIVGATYIVHPRDTNPTRVVLKVTEQWEALYQGTANTPGLWNVETLLVKAALLRKIAKAVPVAVCLVKPHCNLSQFIVHLLPK